MIIVQVELGSHAQRRKEEALPPAFAVLIFFWELTTDRFAKFQSKHEFHDSKPERKCAVKKADRPIDPLVLS